MKARTSARLAWSVCLLATLIIGVAAFLSLVDEAGSFSTDWGTTYNWVGFLASALAFLIVGALIASRRAGSAVGWLCLATGLSISLTGFASEYGIHALVTEPGSLPFGRMFAWFGNWSWVLFVVPIGIFFVLLFPDGRLPSRRWRPVMWAGGAAMVLVGLYEALYPGPIADPPYDVINPVGLEDAETLFAVLEWALLILPLCFLLAGASMILRFRRARGEERQQLKWVAYAATILAVLFGAEMLMMALNTGPNRDAVQRITEDLVTWGFAGLPIAAGIAILRHRLYDIDIIINRTLVYGSLTAVLALVYASGVMGIGGLLREVTDQENNSLVVAASTLAVAAVFRPARGRIQAFIDRYFYRRKYDAAKTLARFSARLRDEIALEPLTADLLAAVRDTVQPTKVSVWLRR